MMTITTFGCGSGDTPSQVVEKFYKYTQENDCKKVADLVSDISPKKPDAYVNDCETYSNRLVSYSIKGETIYENGLGAWVDTEVTIKEDGGEKTNSAPQILVKRGDDWKLTTTENRS
ncbi:MAG TPA: hypothetical protein ENH44_04440 [Actinobacteria bacterium]|nr:hypothetical protein [Actinomycetota bacterium]